MSQQRSAQQDGSLLVLAQASSDIDHNPGETRAVGAVGGRSRTGGRRLHVAIEKRDCEPDLERVLGREKAWDRPILAVLDTWGGAVSFDLVQRIAGNPGSEVIITMQPQYGQPFLSVCLGHPSRDSQQSTTLPMATGFSVGADGAL